MEPTVFVVDGQVHSVPVVKKPKRGRSWLPPLMVLLILVTMAGLAVEAYFLRLFQEELQTLTSQLSIRVNISFEKMIQDQERKPAAHVTSANASGKEALLWDQEHGEAFLHEIGYEPTKGALVVKRSGRYFLYSKVQLGLRSCQSKDTTLRIFTHGIYKISPKYPGEMELMVNRKPYCNSETDGWWDSSFLGGTFKLDETDELYVKVDRKELVRIRDETLAYFGVFMI